MSVLCCYLIMKSCFREKNVFNNLFMCGYFYILFFSLLKEWRGEFKYMRNQQEMKGNGKRPTHTHKSSKEHSWVKRTLIKLGNVTCCLVQLRPQHKMGNFWLCRYFYHLHAVETWDCRNKLWFYTNINTKMLPWKTKI